MKYLKPTLLALSVASALAGCGGGSSSSTPETPTTPATVEKTLSFTGVAVPETDAEKRAITASSKATVSGTDYDIGFNTLMRSGNIYGSGTFGQIFDASSAPIVGTDGSPKISNDNDFASLLPMDGKLFMVSHFETRPAAMYLTELTQNSSTGQLSPVQTRNLDFSGVHGGWVHCAGSVTPWNTHLGSEEYPPNVPDIDPVTGDGGSYYNAMADYYGGDLTALNPYDYGYQVEVKVNSFDDAVVTKHYAMGRIAHELGYVMPNQKTAYMSDDGTNGVLLRFEADTAGDLSSGELFAAKWVQTSADNGGAADLEWVSLGKASDADVKGYLGMNGGTKLGFTDMFARETANADGSCPTAGFKAVNHGGYGIECIKLVDGMEKAASRLETRRYAAYLGATTEFRKMEGITLDPDTKTMYLAMSEVSSGMEDSTTDSSNIGTANDIRLAKNKCGTVYGLTLDDNYVATKMEGVVSGTASTTGDSKNTCDLNGISNPDNVTFIPGYKTLIIGEDTGSGHQNDAIWSYNIESKELTRIMTTPYGSETTSPYFYPDINGFAYLMAVVQHPYGESDSDQLVTGSGADRAYTGYVGPFPSMK